MFLDTLIARNPALVDTALHLHEQGLIEPDSYVLDLDVFEKNAKKLLYASKEYNILPLFMLKQLGRNPYLAKKLVEWGYPGAVVVDYREANRMVEHQIPIMNVGHLVQLPLRQVEKFAKYGVGAFTVYTEAMIAAVHESGKKLNKRQPILLRVTRVQDRIYPGQEGGFSLDSLDGLIEKIKRNYPFVYIKGVTAFPCVLFDYAKKSLRRTPNFDTITEAVERLRAQGIVAQWVDTPSASCIDALPLIAEGGGNVIEPGHGLTGTTPLHAHIYADEEPAVLYLSEISHQMDGHAYCFGGGYYRRGHLQHGLVGRRLSDAKRTRVLPPPLDAIDYHFQLELSAPVGDPVIMAFRYQIFVTRSRLVLVTGVQEGKPRIVGTYTAQGEMIR